MTVNRIAVSTPEAAELLSVSERHLAAMNTDGRMGPRPVRLGNCLRWPVAELAAWVAAGCPNREQWEAVREESKPAMVAG